jgi:hypothetical protein
LGIARGGGVVEKAAVVVVGRTLRVGLEVNCVDGLERHFQQLDEAMADMVESVNRFTFEEAS